MAAALAAAQRRRLELSGGAEGVAATPAVSVPATPVTRGKRSLPPKEDDLGTASTSAGAPTEKVTPDPKSIRVVSPVAEVPLPSPRVLSFDATTTATPAIPASGATGVPGGFSLGACLKKQRGKPRNSFAHSCALEPMFSHAPCGETM